jgi:mono/diheme cytochrome c family protein
MMFVRYHPMLMAGVVCTLWSVATSCSNLKSSPKNLMIDAKSTTNAKVTANGANKAQTQPAILSAANAQVNLMADEAVFEFVTSKCTSCHGIDPNGVAAPNASFWSFRPADLTISALEINVSAPLLYAVLNRTAFPVTGAESKPAAMPPGADSETAALAKGIVRWFDAKLPIVVSDAVARFPDLKSEKRADILAFQCEKTLTLRQFINRFFLAAFDSPPNQIQLIEIQSRLIAPSLEVPVTKAHRQAIVALLDEEIYEDRFKTSGLSKLAASISGISKSELNPGLSPLMKTTLSKEFEMLLRSKWKTWSYETYFSANTVMATDDTAKFYECEPQGVESVSTSSSTSGNPPSPYFECSLKLPRSGFFTTLGYLASRPSSFLVENNNYGRVAGMYFSLFGEGLKAATDGPAGSNDVPPLPGCLEQNDQRAFAGAPRGTAAIPNFGTICQSCHIGRNLASGSVLFRPFGPIGQAFDPVTLGAQGSGDGALIDGATKAGWTQVHKAAPATVKSVDIGYLRTLLKASLEDPKACVVTGSATDTSVVVNTVAALAKELSKNGEQIASGFARHAQRSFANKQSVTLDLILDARSQWNSGKRSIKDLSKSFFLGEHFSCDSN